MGPVVLGNIEDDIHGLPLEMLDVSPSRFFGALRDTMREGFS